MDGNRRVQPPLDPANRLDIRNPHVQPFSDQQTAGEEIRIDDPDRPIEFGHIASAIGGALTASVRTRDNPKSRRCFAFGDQSSSKARFSDRARLTLAANEA
jgi:hypothetical protein